MKIAFTSSAKEIAFVIRIGIIIQPFSEKRREKLKEKRDRERERVKSVREKEEEKSFFFVEKGSKRRAGKENSAPTRKQNLEYFDGIKLHPAMASNSNHRGTSSGIQIGSAWFQRKINLRPQHRGVHLVTEEILRQMPELGQFSVGLCHVQSERLFHFFFSFFGYIHSPIYASVFHFSRYPNGTVFDVHILVEYMSCRIDTHSKKKIKK